MLTSKTKAMILVMVLAFVGLGFFMFAQAYRDVIKSDVVLSAQINYTDGTSRTVDEVVSLSIYDPSVGKTVQTIVISLLLVPNWETEDQNMVNLAGTIAYMYDTAYGQIREILADGVFSYQETLERTQKQERIVIKEIILTEFDLDTLYNFMGSNFVFNLQSVVSMKWGVSSTHALVDATLQLSFDKEGFTIFSAFSSPDIPYLSIDYPQTFEAQTHQTFRIVADQGFWLVPMLVIMLGTFGVMAIRMKRK